MKLKLAAVVVAVIALVVFHCSGRRQVPPQKLKEWTSPTAGMKMILVSAGQFEMGGEENPGLRFREEPLRHWVRITNAFYIGETEVTARQWKAVMGTEPWKDHAEVALGDSHPAVCVCWQDAVDFCRKLGELDEAEYRLPTEAEWEYSCRAGTRTSFHHGNDVALLRKYAWYWDEETEETPTKLDPPHEVAKKKPNSLGLYDMLGNCREWCADRFDHEFYRRSPIDDPCNAGDDGSSPRSKPETRVVRGGTYQSPPRYCRSADRGGQGPSDRSLGLGFRVVRVQTTKTP